MSKWTSADQHRSNKSGWGIFGDDQGMLRLQRVDDPASIGGTSNYFGSDGEAAVYVQTAADSGDALARKAIRLLMRGRSLDVADFGLRLEKVAKGRS